MELRGNYRVLREAGWGGLYYTSDAVWKMKRNPSSVTTAAINTTSGHRCHSALNSNGDGSQLRLNEIAEYTFPIKLRPSQMWPSGQRLRTWLSRCKLKCCHSCCQPSPCLLICHFRLASLTCQTHLNVAPTVTGQDWDWTKTRG